MIKQTLMFTKPAALSLKDRQLVIDVRDADQIVTRPIEDIGFVVVENQMVRMTVPLLNALVDNNVSVIFCDVLLTKARKFILKGLSRSSQIRA